MTGEIKRCYQTLELEPDATLEQVKQAWREQVKVWHPDRFPNDAKMQRKAQERLKAINGAYEALCQFLESGTFSGESHAPTSGAHSQDDRKSTEDMAGQGSPPAPPNGHRESKSPASPKRSKAKVVCLLILAFGALAYAVRLAVEYHAFTSQLAAVKGIHIGDSRDEVKYRLGVPPHVLGPVQKDDPVFRGFQPLYTVSAPASDVNKMPANTKVDDYDEWQYEEVYTNIRLTVQFNKSGVVESINLYSNNEKSNGWGPVAGLYSGDSEDQVFSLGAPSQQHLDGVCKTIEYRDIGIQVILTKGRAYTVTIKEPQNKRALFWRFMRNHYRHG